MQYETIILELLSRIKNLEEDVNKLKMEQAANFSVLQHDEGELDCENDGQIQTTSPVTHKKMTDEMIDICYKCGKKAFSGESVQELAEDISDTTGMNKNSAIMYLYAVKGMLEGTIYKRAISAKAMKRYYNTIFNEYGSAGLKKAIQATRLHIAYRRECGHMVDSIEEVCNDYENKL